MLIEYQVVGYTEPTDGNVQAMDAEWSPLRGYAAMHHLCAGVDPSWRAAFSLEFLRTHDLPPVPGPEARAWLIPTEPDLTTGPDGLTGEVGWLAVDATGESGAVHEAPSVAVIGPSGTGKTTLLLLLAGLEEPRGGLIRLDGVSMARRLPASSRNCRVA